MGRAAWVGCGIAALTLAASSSPGPDFLAPRFPRERMERQLAERERFLIVYGTLDPAGVAALRERATAFGRRLFGIERGVVRPDVEIGRREMAGHSVLLVGGPRENLWTRRLAPALPVSFTERGFRWRERLYERPGDALQLAYPNPYDPGRFLFLVAGNSQRAAVGRGGALLLAGDDWRIYRDGRLVRSGRFAHGKRSWSYDPELDRDREAERERFEAGLRLWGSGSVRLRAPADHEGTPAALRAAESLVARMRSEGLLGTVDPAVSLVLYRSLEEKGILAWDTRPEHAAPDGIAHVARPSGRVAPDLWSAAAVALLGSGGSRESRFLEPAGVWLCGRFEGEPLEIAVSRLYFGGIWPGAEAAASRPARWRSPLVQIPARAILARAVAEQAGGRGREALRALVSGDPAGTLDSLCLRAGVDPRGVARRYAALGDSLARAGRLRSRASGPRPWRPEDGFQRGICLAHSVGLEGGYLSSSCARELERVQALGANWISLTPFGYLPALDVPVIRPSADGGQNEETDEAVCEAAARARALGLRVWLKPHLWTRGWVGDLAFAPRDWTTFFDEYREFILHYALLAQRERVEGLVVGHELTSASAAHPARWRALIGEIRRVYGGTLSYGANWGEEVRQISFWDLLDVIGVSFYPPLAPEPTRSVAALRAGARRGLAEIRAVAEREGKPVVLLEAGFAPRPEAPTRPWEEGRGRPDLETQRACYQALIEALDGEPWVGGVFWWKWFSSDRVGGSADPSFTPRGKPAERILGLGLRRWANRTVHRPSEGTATGGGREGR